MSILPMTAEQRVELESAQRQSQHVRHGKRFQAVLLRADGTPVAVVAQTLGCSQASVSNWTSAWREAGVAGVQAGRPASWSGATAGRGRGAALGRATDQ